MQHLPALKQMFPQLEESDITAVFSGLKADAVENIDACIRRLLHLSGPGDPIGGAWDIFVIKIQDFPKIQEPPSKTNHYEIDLL